VSEPRYRPEFLAALELLARASEIMAAAGKPRPILVGGAVVEFDTRSSIVSGDLDLVSPDHEALSQALIAVGFRAEDRAGWRRGGWYHPDLPIAVDCVSGRYYDGRGDRQRLRVVAFPSGEVLMAPTEELIIDRIGQWEASMRRDSELAAQIAGLLSLADELDEDYVRQRLQEESGVGIDLSTFRR
jgi:hypothetical protein